MNEREFEKTVETPDETIADYVYKDFAGNPVYFDGSDYWVSINGKIDYYG